MKPADPAARVSHETIHAAINTQPRGGLKAATVEAPRQAKPVRGRRRTSCPVTGEGDLIKGAFNRSSISTLVERRTRFVVLRKMRGNGADAVLDSFDRQMKRLPAAPRRSMTRDRGSEMACLPEPAQRLKIDIWSCDPHAPGSAAATRTPTACCVSSGRRRPT